MVTKNHTIVATSTAVDDPTDVRSDPARKGTDPEAAVWGIGN